MNKVSVSGVRWRPDPPYEYYGEPFSDHRRPWARLLLVYTRTREAQYEDLFLGDTRVRHGLDMVEAWLEGRDVRRRDLVAAVIDANDADFWISSIEFPRSPDTPPAEQRDVVGVPLMTAVLEDERVLRDHERACALREAAETAGCVATALALIFADAPVVITQDTQRKIMDAHNALKGATPHADEKTELG